MKRLSESEIRAILAEYEMWLEAGEEEGKCVDFSDMDFSGMNLQRINFYSVDLANADFHDADLSEACFNKANLTNVNFHNARLCNAFLFGANLINADFRGADLTGADLTDTHFSCMNKADTNSMIYDETTLPAMKCPEKGSFIGYKKASGLFTPDSHENEYIVKLRIPEDAKRSSATGNKCRCSKAEVLSITNLDGTEADVTEVWSWSDLNFIYRPGETVEVHDFDECRWRECTSGIHFFMDRKDAVVFKWQVI